MPNNKVGWDFVNCHSQGELTYPLPTWDKVVDLIETQEFGVVSNFACKYDQLKQRSSLNTDNLHGENRCWLDVIADLPGALRQH